VQTLFAYLKGNPTVAAALFGFIGVLIATTATFFGVLTAQFWEHKRKREERQEARLDKLKEAYIEWLAAVQAAMARAINLEYATTKEAKLKVMEEVQSDSVFIGQKLELLESDEPALKKILATVDRYFDLMTDGLMPEATPETRKAARGKFADHVTGVSSWLRDERFALGYKSTPIKAGPLPVARKLRNFLKESQKP
jgi:hypothetical protein